MINQTPLASCLSSSISSVVLTAEGAGLTLRASYLQSGLASFASPLGGAVDTSGSPWSTHTDTALTGGRDTPRGGLTQRTMGAELPGKCLCWLITR